MQFHYSIAWYWGGFILLQLTLDIRHDDLGLVCGSSRTSRSTGGHFLWRLYKLCQQRVQIKVIETTNQEGCLDTFGYTVYDAYFSDLGLIVMLFL